MGTRIELNWQKVQQVHNSGVFFNNLHKIFGVSKGVLIRAVKENLITKIKHKRFMSQKVRQHLSRQRKKYLKNNPELHPWKKKSKFKSVPCEKLKKHFIRSGISFVEEFSPLNNRFFSIDIAFPNEKIGIEVNGQQHYDSEGGLKPYYQERHDLIETNGWRIIEVHYACVYSNDFVDELVYDIKNHIVSDYSKFKKAKKNKEKITCIECGIDKNSKSQSGLCQRCYSISRRIVERPSQKYLLELLQNHSLVELGRRYGVSDKAIKKWVKYYESTERYDKK